MENTIDVLIIGGGPAGMACGLWCANMSQHTLLVEAQAQWGGLQRTNHHPNLWLPGFVGKAGHTIADAMLQELLELPYLQRKAATRVVAVRHTSTGLFEVELSSPTEQNFFVRTKKIVLATGTRPYAPDDLMQLQRLSSRIIIGPEGRTILQDMSHSRILILGGGDNAVEHANYLVKKSNQITVLTRSGFRARNDMLAVLRSQPQITERVCREVQLTLSPDQPEQIALHVPDQPTEFYDYVLVMYGFVPNSEIVNCFANTIRPTINPAGYIGVNGNQQTDVQHLYAIGDITNTQHPCVATAIAQGAVAAHHIAYQGT